MVTNPKISSSNKQIRRVTNVGAGINFLLFLVKLIIGLLAGSLSLVADAFHSLSDIATDFAVLLGVHFGSKAPDADHPYGHGRAETFAAALVAVVLILVGGGMIYYAAMETAAGRAARPEAAVLVVAAISVGAKESLYWVTRKVAVASRSSALYANAWHHRTDALSSVAVMLGVVALWFGFDYGDQVAAIAVGIMVVLVGVQVTGDTLRELTESAVDSETIKQITEIIRSEDRIRGWHKLRTRMVGREVFLDLHILVDPTLAVTSAHEISESLEQALQQRLPRPANIIVHIEPDIPELRK